MKDLRRKSNYPNILLIVVDCLRQDRCPTLGEPTVLRFWPKLCQRGANCTQMISSASTTPVAMASLLSGQYGFVHGVRSIRGPALDSRVETLATILQASGYHTYAFVTGPMLATFGMDRGFTSYEHRQRQQNFYTDWGQRLRERFSKGQFESPWFVLLHLFELHRPRQLNGLNAPKYPATQYELAWQQLDARLDDFLSDIPDDTLLIFTADHGESLTRRSDRTALGHLYRKMRQRIGLPRRPVDWKHHGFFVYEELIRIPFALAGPGVPAGRLVQQVSRQVDILPTILELVGLKTNSVIHGRSLVPLLRGHTLPECTAYLQSGLDDKLRYWHGLRTQRWKYVERPRTTCHLDQSAMLFDLEQDPQEKRNIIRRHPDLSVRMRVDLDKIVYGNSDQLQGTGQAISKEEQSKLDQQLKALGYL